MFLFSVTVGEEGLCEEGEEAIVSAEPVVSVLTVVLAKFSEEIITESTVLIVAVVAKLDDEVSVVVLSSVCTSTDTVLADTSSITTDVEVSVKSPDDVVVENTVETEAGETFSVVLIFSDVM